MNNIQNLLHSPEIQEKLHIKSAHIKLDADKKRQLGNAYLKLYFGLSCMNWTNKKNLGTAWQTAFTQAQNILNARDENNPAIQFLKIMHETHKQTWPRHIMAHPQRDAVFNGDPRQMREYAIRNIRSAMGEITMLTSQCKFEMDKSQAKQATKQPVRVAAQNQATAPLGVPNMPEKNMEQQLSADKPVQVPSEQKPVGQESTDRADKNQREYFEKVIRGQMPMQLKIQQADQMSLDAKQKDAIPQTRTGEPIVAQRAVNSDAAPQQKAGTNSKQVALRPVEQPRSLSREEAIKQNRAQIVNLWEIMRMQMLNQKNGHVA